MPILRPQTTTRSKHQAAADRISVMLTRFQKNTHATNAQHDCRCIVDKLCRPLIPQQISTRPHWVINAHWGFWCSSLLKGKISAGDSETDRSDRICWRILTYFLVHGRWCRVFSKEYSRKENTWNCRANPCCKTLPFKSLSLAHFGVTVLFG